MEPDAESAIKRVLETLKIPSWSPEGGDHVANDRELAEPGPAVAAIPAGPAFEAGDQVPEAPVPPAPQDAFAQASADVGYPPRAPSNSFDSMPWGFTLPTAQSLDTLYGNVSGGAGLPAHTGFTPESPQFDQTTAEQTGALFGQPSNEKDYESDSGEEDEAENDVIEQISNRIGTLKIAGDGHLRFYGATSNLNLVDVSATQQRQRPDARSVRHDGQDILNHLRVGQPVDQALEDHLVELYFTWQNPSTYVVDKEMYMAARSKWRNEFDDTPFYSEVLTNAMYAHQPSYWRMLTRVGAPLEVLSKRDTTLHSSPSQNLCQSSSQIEPRRSWRLSWILRASRLSRLSSS